MHLVDANVLSEATRPNPNPDVVRWLREHERALVVNPIVLGEIRYGILLLRHSKKRSALEDWYERGVQRLRCLDWDTDTARYWSELLARLRRSGRSMPVKDSLNAASAMQHGVAVATLNGRDFANTGVEVVDPRLG